MTPEALLIECGCALTAQGWQVPPSFTHSTAFLPRDARKSLRYRGRRFTVDGSVLGLRLWFGKTLVSRRWGFGL